MIRKMTIPALGLMFFITIALTFGALTNDEYLKSIQNLKGRNPVVNCTTCHRGQTKPALNLPEAEAK